MSGNDVHILQIQSEKSAFIKMACFSLINIIVYTYILSMYKFQVSNVTIMFMILVPILFFSFFWYKDLLHPFNIFFMHPQFLFIYNMLDVNANKKTFRYGTLDQDYFETAFVYSIIVIIIWYIMMYWGYTSGSKLKRFSFLNIFSYKLKRPILIGTLLFLISFTSFSYTVIMKDGLVGMVLALTNRREAYEGLGYMIQLISLSTMSSLIFLLSGYKKTSFVLTIITFLMLSMFGGRAGAFFGSIFPFIICYHYKEKKIKLSGLIIIGSFAILFAIFLGNYRLYQNFSLNFEGLKDILSTVANSAQGGEILPSLVGSLVKQKIPFAKGSTLINILFAPIPRKLWEEKPRIDESGIVGEALMGEDGWGLPPGPYGISYYNFGIIGVIIFAFIVGVLIYWFYNLFINKKGKEGVNIGIIFYSLTVHSLFNIMSTSSQINIIWYSVIFLLIRLLDSTSILGTKNHQ